MSTAVATISESDRRIMQEKGWQVTEEEALLIVNNLNQMRFNTDGKWSPGACLLPKVNRFDCFGKAGIRDGDIIIAVNGEPLTDELQFVLTLSRLGVGAKPVLQIRRADNLVDVTMELLKRNVSFEIDEVQVEFERKISP